MDVAKPLRTVRAGPREDDGRAARTAVLGERPEERVDRVHRVGAARRLGAEQPTSREGHRSPGRDEVDLIRAHLHPGLDAVDRQLRVLREQLVREQPGVPSGVSHDDERHPALTGHVVEEPSECLEPSGRRSDAHDERAGRQRFGVLREAAGVVHCPVVPRPGKRPGPSLASAGAVPILPGIFQAPFGIKAGETRPPKRAPAPVPGMVEHGRHDLKRGRGGTVNPCVLASPGSAS